MDRRSNSARASAGHRSLPRVVILRIAATRDDEGDGDGACRPYRKFRHWVQHPVYGWARLFASSPAFFLPARPAI
jgi:hypothetical protein